MSRFHEFSKDLVALCQMAPKEVETAFNPPKNNRRKDDNVMPDYADIHDRIMREESKANLYFMCLKYKQAYLSSISSHSSATITTYMLKGIMALINC